MTDPRDEILDVVDDVDRIVGQARREDVYAGKLRHRTVMAVVRRSTGEILIHRRTDTKLVAAGQFDMMIGGVVDAGESYDAAVERELAEEAGITGVEPRFATKVRYDGSPQAPWAQWICVYDVTWDGVITPQEAEVAWHGWVTPEELAAPLADDSQTWCADSAYVWERYRTSAG